MNMIKVTLSLTGTVAEAGKLSS